MSCLRASGERARSLASRCDLRGLGALHGGQRRHGRRASVLALVAEARDVTRTDLPLARQCQVCRYALVAASPGLPPRLLGPHSEGQRQPVQGPYREVGHQPTHPPSHETHTATALSGRCTGRAVRGCAAAPLSDAAAIVRRTASARPGRARRDPRRARRTTSCGRACPARAPRS